MGYIFGEQKKPHWSVLTSVPHLCGWQTAEGIDQTELMKTHPQTELMEAYGGVDPRGKHSNSMEIFPIWK